LHNVHAVNVDIRLRELASKPS